MEKRNLTWSWNLRKMVKQDVGEAFWQRGKEVDMPVVAYLPLCYIIDSIIRIRARN